MRPSFYLVFRGVWAAVFLGHLIAHIASHDEGAYYLIYLTTWALITQTISEMLLFSLAILGYRRLSGPPPEKLPVAVRIEVALWSAVHPVAVVVWLLYFSLVNPIWSFESRPWVTIFAHFVNLIMLVIGLFASRMPFSALKNFGWSLIYGLAYGLWTIIHYLARVGASESQPCLDYPLNECPIYDAFDWHAPLMPALILGSIYLIGVPVITGIFGACVTCRDRLDPESKRNEKNMGVGKQPDTGEKVMAEEDKPSSPECA